MVLEYLVVPVDLVLHGVQEIQIVLEVQALLY